MNIQGIDLYNQKINLPGNQRKAPKEEAIMPNSHEGQEPRKEVNFDIVHHGKNSVPENTPSTEAFDMLKEREKMEKMKENINELIRNQEKSFKAIKDLLYTITPGMVNLLKEE
jgi:hypothetical protein